MICTTFATCLLTLWHPQESYEQRQKREADGKARLKERYRQIEEKKATKSLVFDPSIKHKPPKRRNFSARESPSPPLPICAVRCSLFSPS